MNTGYLIYQAERPRSAAEQRQADILHAEIARSAARRWHALATVLAAVLAAVLGTPLRALRSARSARRARLPERPLPLPQEPLLSQEPLLQPSAEWSPGCAGAPARPC